MSKVSMERSAIEWNFGKQPGNTRENEPTQEEFFSNESLITEVAAVVRESIQNSLDERLDKSRPIRVRFKLGTQTSNLSQSYFDQLLPHADTVLPGGVPRLDEDSKFLVVEDFNTLGLEGSTSSATPEFDPVKDREKIKARGHKDSYWYFEWSTGKTNKAGGKRGSWGVGKIVFPRASALKSYLVLSERQVSAAPDGDSCILFGHSILNFRWVNGNRFVPDCQWMATDRENELLVPSANSVEADRFRKDWKLQRKSGEFGTSIVVPFVNKNISASQLLHSIARDYFVTILSGMLICDVEDIDGTVISLDSNSLSSLISTWEEEPSKEFRSNDEMIELCNLYKQFQSSETVSFSINNPVPKPNDWNSLELSEELAKDLAQAFDSGKSIEIKVATIVPKSRDSEPSRADEFIVLLKKIEDLQSKTVFCREGILIPDAYPIETKGFVSIVLVGKVSDESDDNNSLATLLKRAEGPSHEKWTVTASHFKGQYRPEELGNRTVSWVKRSVQSIYQIIRRLDLEPDDKSLAKYFPEIEDGSGEIRTVEAGEDSGSILKQLVKLRAEKIPSNTRMIQLHWNNVNIGQSSYVLKLIAPVDKIIAGGEGKVNTATFTVDDSWETATFQVEVMENEKLFKSNMATLSFKTFAGIPDLYAERHGQGIVVRPMDCKQIESGMKFELDLGYIVRGGTTFGSESEHDIDAYKAFVTQDSHGIRVEKGIKANQVIAVIVDPNFEIYFAGFNRLLDPAVNSNFLGVFN